METSVSQGGGNDVVFDWWWKLCYDDVLAWALFASIITSWPVANYFIRICPFNQFMNDLIELYKIMRM